MWTREIVGINNNKTVESIPFLSIARSLGDYWSYNESTGESILIAKKTNNIYVFQLMKCLGFEVGQ